MMNKRMVNVMNNMKGGVKGGLVLLLFIWEKNNMFTTPVQRAFPSIVRARPVAMTTFSLSHPDTRVSVCASVSSSSWKLHIILLPFAQFVLVALARNRKTQISHTTKRLLSEDVAYACLVLQSLPLDPALCIQSSLSIVSNPYMVGLCRGPEHKTPFHVEWMQTVHCAVRCALMKNMLISIFRI